MTDLAFDRVRDAVRSLLDHSLNAMGFSPGPLAEQAYHDCNRDLLELKRWSSRVPRPAPNTPEAWELTDALEDLLRTGKALVDLVSEGYPRLWALYKDVYLTGSPDPADPRVGAYAEAQSRVINERSRLESEMQKPLNTLWSIEEQQRVCTSPTFEGSLTRQGAKAERAHREHEHAVDTQRGRDRLVAGGNPVEDPGRDHRALQIELLNALKGTTYGAQETARHAHRVFSEFIHYPEMLAPLRSGDPPPFVQEFEELCRAIKQTEEHMHCRGIHRTGAAPVEFPPPLRPDAILTAVADRTEMHGIRGRSATHIGYMLGVQLCGDVRATLPANTRRSDGTLEVTAADHRHLHEKLRGKRFPTFDEVQEIGYAIQQEEARATHRLIQALQSEAPAPSPNTTRREEGPAGASLDMPPKATSRAASPQAQFTLSTLPFPLSRIGPLPQDLLAALNAAVYLATLAGNICALATQEGAGDQEMRLVATMMEQSRDQWNDCQAAIRAVMTELLNTRSGAVRFGPLVTATAHEAALELSRQVRDEVWSASLLEWAQCLIDPSARMDPERIVTNCDSVQARLRSKVTSWPVVDEIIAEVKIEAAKAAERRGTIPTASTRPAPQFSAPTSTAEQRLVTITDHLGGCCSVDLAVCQQYGMARRPDTPADRWPALYGQWLAQQFAEGQPLELWKAPGAIWLVVRQGGECGVAINDDQLRDLQPITTTTTSTTTSTTTTSPPDAPSSRGAVVKLPPDGAIKAYRLKCILGVPKQSEIAKRLSVELGRTVSQGQVSRWLQQAEEFFKAGGVLPELPDAPFNKPMPIDPERLDLGRRLDGRTERQRGRRSEDD